MTPWPARDAVHAFAAEADRLVIDAALLVRDTVLRQNAYHPHDARSTLAKTFALAAAARAAYRAALAAVEAGASFTTLDLTAMRHALITLRDAPDADVAERAGAAMRTAAALTPRHAEATR
mgnify:CR=1 FL=1